MCILLCVCVRVDVCYGWLISIQIAETRPGVHVSGSSFLSSLPFVSVMYSSRVFLLFFLLSFFYFHPYSAAVIPGNGLYTDSVFQSYQLIQLTRGYPKGSVSGVEVTNDIYSQYCILLHYI